MWLYRMKEIFIFMRSIIEENVKLKEKVEKLEKEIESLQFLLELYRK